MHACEHIESADCQGQPLARCMPDVPSEGVGADAPRDAEVSVVLGKDAMQAWIDIVPASGGQAPSVEGLVLALAAEGVVHGLQMEAIEQACLASQPLRLAAALGTPARKGEDARFELLVADTRDRKPKVDDQGRVDFHELGDIPMVAPGQALMRRHPATPGIAGRDVRGEPVAASAGKDLAFDATLVGAAPSKDDPNLLCATTAGQPVHTDHAVMVEQVLRLAQVDLATGNIVFDGTIEVSGDVHPGMKVQASGDLIVTGLVEGAQLTAGGSVRVGGGVIAKSVVSAGQSFSARFVEHSEVRAETKISIDDTSVHGDLQARDEVRVGVKAPQRGRLVGGSTRAMRRVTVPTLGAAAGGLTRIQVGVDPVLDARQRELAGLVEARKADEAKLGTLVRHLQQHGDPRGMLERARASWQLALNALGEVLQELAEVEAQLALAGSASVEVLCGVEGDVDLVFGLVLRRLRRPCGAGSFGIDADGRVVQHLASGASSEVD